MFGSNFWSQPLLIKKGMDDSRVEQVAYRSVSMVNFSRHKDVSEESKEANSVEIVCDGIAYVILGYVEEVGGKFKCIEFKSCSFDDVKKFKDEFKIVVEKAK